MTERKLRNYAIAVFLGLLPVYGFFAIGFFLLPVEQWMSGLILVGIVTLTLAGCSIGGGYDVGILWHYHGVPETIYRPDIDSLRED